MSGTVFVAVLCAACLHAVWNSMIKSGSDKKGSMTALVFGHVPLALIVLLFSPVPAVESWGYILVGAVIHFAYQVLLLNAYRYGDLTQVYPIARGIAPLLVVLVSTLWLGIVFSKYEIIAVVLITFGLGSLALVRRKDGTNDPRAFWLAIGTGCMIASYSLVDGFGARLAGTALGYYGWLSIFNGVLMAGYVVATHRHSPLTGSVQSYLLWGIVGGGVSFLAYAIVVWGFTQAPIALVSALRETSIIFALLIGVFVLKEKLSLTKVLATFFTLSGAALLRLFR